MTAKDSILEPSFIIPLSDDGKKRIHDISKKLGSEDLFPNKVEKAKETLKDINTLPF